MTILDTCHVISDACIQVGDLVTATACNLDGRTRLALVHRRLQSSLAAAGMDKPLK